MKNALPGSTSTAVATPETAVDSAATPLLPYPAQGSAAAAGAAVAYSIPSTTAPDGTMFLAPGLPPAGTGTVQPPKGQPIAPPTDPSVDPNEVLFKPKPKDVAALVTKMGELLYGEGIAPAARTKIEKFLLDGKKTLSEKDLDNPAFRAKAREALHAMMCLPEYQLN